MLHNMNGMIDVYLSISHFAITASWWAQLVQSLIHEMNGLFDALSETMFINSVNST